MVRQLGQAGEVPRRPPGPRLVLVRAAVPAGSPGGAVEEPRPPRQPVPHRRRAVHPVGAGPPQAAGRPAAAGSRFLGQLGLVRWQFTPFPPQPQLQVRAGKGSRSAPSTRTRRWTWRGAGGGAVPHEDVRSDGGPRHRAEGAAAAAPAGGFDLLHFSGHGLADRATSARPRSSSRGGPWAARWRRTT